ncbi:MAG TPA: hypothetical protein VLR47_05965, partial [Rhodospirillales bacterium]|nr:hypothetical protein [Rhodospirillales bacterium]
RTAMPRLFTRLRQRFTEEWVGSWTPPAPADGEEPAFLIGFPRSGTTLIDKNLDAHPGLSTM